ncbi:MAG: type III-B CRISPR module RAMP protein Cmr4 [Bacteroidales bacterium]|jgi:CRISPR-associated protein Cmr4|nr:type III-B CRISPR module RAMP protein Cmr4 [Bacteroidales bacterium]
METQAYLIQCITNMHVGSGDATYGIIDKMVQRDPVTNYPTIHASSLKGALRERFEKVWENDLSKVNEIFGKKTDNDQDAESGNCNFLNADLLALPVRCTHKQFALSLCPQSIEFINKKAKLLLDKEIIKSPTTHDKLFTNDSVDDIYIEDDQLGPASHSPLLENDISIDDFDAFNQQYAIVEDTKFDNYTANLPVIARNRLGKDKNLWYEEVVPHQSVFITNFIPGPSINKNVFDNFLAELKQNIFQIGANSSVGFGLCKFYKVSVEYNKKENHE